MISYFSSESTFFNSSLANVYIDIFIYCNGEEVSCLIGKIWISFESTISYIVFVLDQSY